MDSGEAVGVGGLVGEGAGFAGEEGADCEVCLWGLSVECVCKKGEDVYFVDGLEFLHVHFDALVYVGDLLLENASRTIQSLRLILGFNIVLASRVALAEDRGRCGEEG